MWQCVLHLCLHSRSAWFATLAEKEAMHYAWNNLQNMFEMADNNIQSFPLAEMKSWWTNGGHRGFSSCVSCKFEEEKKYFSTCFKIYSLWSVAPFFLYKTSECLLFIHFIPAIIVVSNISKKSQIHWKGFSRHPERPIPHTTIWTRWINGFFIGTSLETNDFLTFLDCSRNSVAWRVLFEIYSIPETTLSSTHL